MTMTETLTKKYLHLSPVLDYVLCGLLVLRCGWVHHLGFLDPVPQPPAVVLGVPAVQGR